jgi:hypothetical protein
MTDPQPTPPDPRPALRVPLHQRVQQAEDRATALEDALNELIARYNQFAADVSAELGLGTGM